MAEEKKVKIKVLGDIPHIRLRPGMYIGSIDDEDGKGGAHHLLQEVLDNVADIAGIGQCSEAEIILSSNQQEITVKDNGPGIPIEEHSETKESTLKTVFTVLKSGGKFDDNFYKTAGGLHGVGITAVNALSSHLKVINVSENKKEILKFEKGILTNSQISEASNEKSGLSITFTPDPEIFKDNFTYFKVDVIKKRLKELAYLIPNLTLIFHSSPEADPINYHYSSGLIG